MQANHRGAHGKGPGARGRAGTALERLHANRWKAIALAQALATLAAVGLMARAQAPDDDWLVPDARVAAAADDDEVASDTRLAASAPPADDKDWVASDERLAAHEDSDAADEATRRLASAADTLGLGDWLPRMAAKGDLAVHAAVAGPAGAQASPAAEAPSAVPASTASAASPGSAATAGPTTPGTASILSIQALAATTSTTASAAASGNASGTAPSPFGPATVVAATDRLAETRGGFQLPGLNLSFGIERAVYVNGNLMATSVLTIDSVSRAVEASRVTVGGGLRVAGGSADVLANGPGSLTALLPQQIPNGALVLQNSLSDQRLQAQTLINATLEASPLLRASRFEALMRDSTLNSLRR